MCAFQGECMQAGDRRLCEVTCWTKFLTLSTRQLLWSWIIVNTKYQPVYGWKSVVSLRWWWCRTSRPRMSLDILGTNCDQCPSMVQCCFTSTETVRLIRTESPGRPPRLSHSSWTLNITTKRPSAINAERLERALGRALVLSDPDEDLLLSC